MTRIRETVDYEEGRSVSISSNFDIRKSFLYFPLVYSAVEAIGRCRSIMSSRVHVEVIAYQVLIAHAHTDTNSVRGF